MSWRDFWNGDHAIYVSERHKLLHYDRVATDIAALISTPGLTVLDHGCGEALSADRVAGACATLYLYDAAPTVQDKLRARFGQDGRIVVLSTPALDLLGHGALDVVVVNSLLQYLARAELEALLDFWAERLKPGGRLVIADVIPPDVGALTDVRALMTFAWQGGFLVAAAVGLVRTFFSDYRRLRGEHGLTHHAAADMLAILAAHGFDAARAADNVGHNPARMTFVATRRAG